MARTLASILALALAAMAAPAGAATIKVQNTHDHGAGSLRKAIEKADPGDRVQVPGGHYALTTGVLAFDKDLKIAGAGARNTVLDANGDSRLLEIGGTPAKVTVSGLTVRERDAGDSDGGAITSNSKLVLKRVAVLDNSVGPPDSLGSGGGVDTSDNLIIRQSLFAGNHGYNGGAASAHVIKAFDSTFTRNSAGSPQANGNGGAFDDEVVLVDSTVVGNRCFNDSCGGAVYDTTTLKGTVLADNFGFEDNGMPPGSPGNPGQADNCGDGIPTSKGHNLDNHHDCNLSKQSDISGKSPKLGNLANNGGPTNTLAFETSSPLFNNGAGNCTGHDQRGVKRPQGARCDIGAFELDP
jgi:hypothetical protein